MLLKLKHRLANASTMLLKLKHRLANASRTDAPQAQTPIGQREQSSVALTRELALAPVLCSGSLLCSLLGFSALVLCSGSLLGFSALVLPVVQRTERRPGDGTTNGPLGGLLKVLLKYY